MVTSFKFKLHKVNPVLAGSLTYPLEEGWHVINFFLEYTRDLPDELTASLTFMTNSRSEHVISFDLCYSGDDLERGEKLLKPVHELKGFLQGGVRIMPYCEFPSIYDNPLRAGLQSYWRANYIDNISDGLIDIILDYFVRVPSSKTLVMFEHYHGIMSQS